MINLDATETSVVIHQKYQPEIPFHRAKQRRDHKRIRIKIPRQKLQMQTLDEDNVIKRSTIGHDRG